MIAHRTFLAGTGAVLLAAPLAAEAQTDRSKPRIAILFVSVPTANLSGPKPKEDSMGAFLEGMHELGFGHGQNIVIERRSAEGQADRYSALVQEMVNLGADVLVVSGAPILVLAAQQATRTIPIVMVGLGGDPVALGLAKSLPSPGGNVTGSTFGVDSAMNGKRLALLKEVAPRISRVAVLHPPSDGPDASTKNAARALGLPLRPCPSTPHSRSRERSPRSPGRRQMLFWLAEEQFCVTSGRSSSSRQPTGFPPWACSLATREQVG